jgi:hypothetical protein
MAGRQYSKSEKNRFEGSDWTTVLDHQRLSNSCTVDVTDYT